jgi:hypothetical protein
VFPETCQISFFRILSDIDLVNIGPQAPINLIKIHFHGGKLHNTGNSDTANPKSEPNWTAVVKSFSNFTFIR